MAPPFRAWDDYAPRSTASALSQPRGGATRGRAAPPPAPRSKRTRCLGAEVRVERALVADSAGFGDRAHATRPDAHCRIGTSSLVGATRPCRHPEGRRCREPGAHCCRPASWRLRELRPTPADRCFGSTGAVKRSVRAKSRARPPASNISRGPTRKDQRTQRANRRRVARRAARLPVPLAG